MPFRCIVGGSRAARDIRARELAGAAGLPLLPQPTVAAWPFLRHILPSASSGLGVVWLPDLHQAFLAGQIQGTRLVLTQSTYQLQRWVDWIDASPGRSVVAHASRVGLEQAASEAFAGRGPWFRIDLVPLDGDEDVGEPVDIPANIEALRASFRQGSPQARLDACRAAAAADPTSAAVRLALASVWMERQALDEARAALQQAVTLAPDWEAVWFEYGKLALREDDLERAAERFAEAARLMPSFSAALGNLGAALAETERPDEAIAALQGALRSDPRGYPVLNNLGVICREQGRLDDAVRTAREVISLAPGFVFGYYNLAHALFLQGRFEQSRDAYAEGYARDPQKNPVQACRMAMARAAAGDAATAARDMAAVTDAMAPDTRAGLLDETEETLSALAGAAIPHAAEVRQLLDAVQEIRQRTGS
jgi:tetratricopeptide (TPR) repeat protein